MKPIQSYHFIQPKDLFWRPSNLMKIPNADFLERTGSGNLGAWQEQREGRDDEGNGQSPLP